MISAGKQKPWPKISVEEVLRVPEEDIVAAPSSGHDSVAEMCLRGEEFVSIIDVERVLVLDADR